MVSEDKKSGLTVFEGMTSVRAVISAHESGRRRIESILIDKSRRKSRAKELGWLQYKSGELGFEICFTDGEEIASLATGSTHGGVIALCHDRAIDQLTSGNIIKNGFYAMIEGIEDPYNFGYAIRSLYACGADGVILSPRNWMSAAGCVCRSSAGTSELIPMYSAPGTDAAVMFREAGYRVVCAGIRDSVSSFDCDLKRPLFLVVGGEKRGISSSLLSLADCIVRIDYERTFAGSLSAASACDMLAYEIMRQNRK